MSMGREIKDFVAAMSSGVNSMVRLRQEDAREKHYGAMEELYKAREADYQSRANKRNAEGVAFGDTQKKAIDDAGSRAGSDDGSGSSGSGSGGGSDGDSNSASGVALEADDLKDPNKLVDKLVQGEANGNWNAVYGGAKLDLSHMTIAQIQQYQQGMKRQLDSTAVGGPQFVQGTLKAAVAQSGLDPNKTYFTPEVQRQLAVQLIKNRGYDAYMAGKLPQSKFVDNLAHEWAALPTSKGSGAYDGYNGNHVRVALGTSLGGTGVKVASNAPAPKPAAPNATPAAKPGAPNAIPVEQQPIYKTPDGTTYGGDNARFIPGAKLVTPAPAQPAPAQPAPTTTPAPARPTAIPPSNPPPNPNVVSSALPDDTDDTSDPLQPQYLAAGGMVRGYADGGMVDDGADIDASAAQADYESDNSDQGVLDDEPEAETEAPTQGIPTQVASTGPATPSPAGAAPSAPSADDVSDAVHDGLQFIGHHYGLKSKSALPDEEHGNNVKRFHNNEGAPSRREVEEAKRVVDPDGKLNENQRNMAALYAGWRFYNEHGDPTKAAKYAGQFLMVARAEAQAAGSRAQEALKRGDVSTATKEIQRAYDNVPDGKRIQIGQAGRDGAEFRVIDENGDVTQQGKATMDQLMFITTGMKDGSEWYRSMAGVASKSSNAQKLQEQRRAALEQFDTVTGGSDPNRQAFLSTLTPEARQAFSQLHPSDQKQRVADWGKQHDAQVANDQTQAAAADEQGFAQQSANIYRAQRQLEEAQRRSNGADTDIVQSARVNLKGAQDAAMDWASASPGRAKYVRMLGVQTVPSSTQLRSGLYGGVGGATPGGGSAGGSRAGTSRGERANSAIDADTGAAIRADRHEAMKPLDNMSDEDFRNGGGKAVASAANTASMLDVADGAARKAMAAQGQKGSQGISMSGRLRGDGAGGDLYAPITTAVSKQFGKDIEDPERQDDRNSIVGASSKIMQLNSTITPEASVRAVKLALDPSAQMQIDGKTGKVRFGKGMQPLYLDRETITLLADLRGKQKSAAPDKAPPPEEKPEPAPTGPGPADPNKRRWLENTGLLGRSSRAQPASPGSTGNQTETKKAPSALPITGFTGGTF